MKFSSYPGVQTALGVILIVLGTGTVTAVDTVGVASPETLAHSYGRAGGLVGADRITTLGRSNSQQVGIAYDKDVAARTNMPRSDTGAGTVGIGYDKDVVERTNMQRAAKDAAVKSVGVEAPRSN